MGRGGAGYIIDRGIMPRQPGGKGPGVVKPKPAPPKPVAAPAQPAPLPAPVAPPSPPPAPIKEPITLPAPVAPPSGVPSMQGMQSAAAPMDALNGPSSAPLRQGLGTRQPPSLQALLQGLRY